MAERIVLDAGHGGSNPGAMYQGRRESDDALRLAMAVGQILEANGYDVIYTRTSDITQSVGQKAAIANEEGADLFISIHRNAAEYPGQYTGVQSLIYNDSGFKKDMAENINANMEKLGFRNAGVSIRPNLVVLNSTQMPAILVEAGFIDSEKDNQLFDSKFQEMAQAIADGIMETLDRQTGTGSGAIAGNSMGGSMAGNNGIGGNQMMGNAGMNGSGTGNMGMGNNGMGSNGMGNGSVMRPCPICPSTPEDGGPEMELYRVQAGAFRERENADNLLSLLENDGFPAYIIYQDGLYKVQVGAFSRLSNAIAMEREVRAKGYNTYITT